MSSALRSSTLFSVIRNGAKSLQARTTKPSRASASTSAAPVSASSFRPSWLTPNITPESSGAAGFKWPRRDSEIGSSAAWTASGLASISELESLKQENARLSTELARMRTRQERIETHSTQEALAEALAAIETHSTQEALTEAQATIASVNSAIGLAQTQSADLDTSTSDDLSKPLGDDLRRMLNTAKAARKTACSDIRKWKSKVNSLKDDSMAYMSTKDAMRSFEAACKAKDDANEVITSVTAELDSRRSVSRRLAWWETETGAALADTRREINRTETRVKGYMRPGSERNTLLSDVETARSSIARQIRKYKKEYRESRGQFTAS